MQTIQLKVNEKVYEKLMALLSRFGKEDVEIVSDEFVSDRDYLQKELDEIKSGKAEFYSQEEMEKRSEELISKYEDKV
ncbi:MAG: hypothetical protein K0B37_18050 [Bacteroidales bacterium]|nr:hypothetical protein [Bacteroidales bacterium]